MSSLRKNRQRLSSNHFTCWVITSYFEENHKYFTHQSKELPLFVAAVNGNRSHAILPKIVILRTRERISFIKIQIHTRCIISDGSPAEIGPPACCEGRATKTPRHLSRLDSIFSNGYTSGMGSQDTPPTSLLKNGITGYTQQHHRHF